MNTAQTIDPNPADRAARAPYERMLRVLDLVAAERARQRALLAEGVILDDCASPDTDLDACLRVLGEEFGEVARAIDGLKTILRRHPGYATLSLRTGEARRHLRDELVQLAAVAVATAESLEGRQP